MIFNYAGPLSDSLDLFSVPDSVHLVVSVSAGVIASMEITPEKRRNNYNKNVEITIIMYLKKYI